MEAARRNGPRPRTGAWQVLAVGALVLVQLVATGLGADPPAQACSCAEVTVDSALGEGDAAFLGAAVDRREGPMGTIDPVAYTFDVTEAVKGDLPARIEVSTGAGDGDCGVTFEIGEPVGVVLRRNGERWTTSICGGVWLPDELRSPRALAAPTGGGQVALLATGRTGDAMIASFDAGGALAAWGLGNARDEPIHLRLCPGSAMAVGMALDPAGVTSIVRRSVATLAPIETVPLPVRGPDQWPQLIDHRGFECTSPDGDVAFLVSASGYTDAPADNIVVWVDGTTPTVHSVDHGWDLAVAPDPTSAYLLAGADGTTLEVLTLADGSRRVVTELPDGVGGRFLAVDDATDRVAVIATSAPTVHSRGSPEAPDDRLVVLGAGGTVLTTAALPGPGLVQSVQWLDGDRLLVVWGLPSTRVDVVSLDGTVESSFAPVDWTWGTPAVVGDRLYAGTADGVVSTKLDGSDERPLAPSIARVRDVVAVPDGPVAEPMPTPTIPAPTTTSTTSTTSTTTSTTSTTSTTTSTTSTTASATSVAPTVVDQAAGGGGSGFTALAGVVLAAAAAGAGTIVVRRRRRGRIGAT